MELEYHGGNSVTIGVKTAKLYIDPAVESMGLKNPSVADAPQLLTEKRFGITSASGVVFEGPGEYEIGPYAITGIAAKRHIDGDTKNGTSIYRIVVAGIAVCVLGNISNSLDEKQLESIGVTDVLVVPIGGGGYTLDAKDATTIVKQIDPKIVVPVHYSDSALSYEVPQDELDLFKQALKCEINEVDKLKLRSENDLPSSMVMSVVSRK